MASLEHLEKLFLFMFLMSGMLGVGLNLGVRSILMPWRDVSLVSIALALNFVAAPTLAWLLTRIIPLQHGHAVGLLLIGGAAGAPFLPKVVEIAHGDLSLATSHMVLLTFGTILFIPLALPWFIPGFSADPWAIARPLMITIVMPLLLGVILRPLAPMLSQKAARVLAVIANASLLLLFVLMIIVHKHELLKVIGSGAIATVVLYFVVLFAISWLATSFRPKVRGVMGLEVSTRNFGAAFVPAAASIRDPAVTIMLTVSAIVGVLMSFVAALWVKRHSMACASHGDTH